MEVSALERPLTEERGAEISAILIQPEASGDYAM